METKETEEIKDETEIKPVFEEHTTVFEKVNEEQEEIDKPEELTETKEHYEEDRKSVV